MIVNEYVTHFTQLSRYAPNDVDTKEKKQDCFLNGHNDGLAYAQEARNCEKFHDMVNKALVLENCLIEPSLLSLVLLDAARVPVRP
jgi:hypothetical protein